MIIVSYRISMTGLTRWLGRRRAEALGYRYEGHLRGLNQPAEAGFVDVACPFRGQAGPEALGYRYEGHLRGLNQPAEAGFVDVACPFRGQAGPYKATTA